jgi:hypothetical protein
MERFIARENLRRYRARLQGEKNPELRETLSKLIADEEAKLGAAENEARRKRSGQSSSLSDSEAESL